MAQVEKVRVGVIGAGRMADFHLQVLSAMPDVEISALASRGQLRRSEMSQKYHVPKTYGDFRAMLDEEQLNAVYIAVSVAHNFDVAKECLGRGVNSLIEKPPGLSLEQTEELAKVSEKSGAIHMVGLQRRFSSHILAGLRLLKARGPLMSIEVQAPERFDEIKAKAKFPTEVLSKWIFANGIHCIDMLVFLGGRIRDVVATRHSWREALHPDSLHALVFFADHIVGHYSSNWRSPGQWSVRLYGEGCRVDIEPMEKGRIIFADGKQQELPIDPLDIQFKPGLYAQNRMFLDACKGVCRVGYPAATLHEAAIAMKLTEAIYDPDRQWANERTAEPQLGRPA